MSANFWFALQRYNYFLKYARKMHLACIFQFRGRGKAASV